MNIFRWISDNILFVLTLFLLAFIPLYPKLPLLDVKNTWVYVRAEDFVAVFVVLIWITLFIRRKITLNTPLTFPIILFWIIGGITTIHAMILIFPSIADVFPNVAFLSFLRRIEYISLFFIGYAGIKDKRFLPYVLAVLAVTLFFVVAYGVGQKYFGFPAYLTMNEEFAKGLPIRLSSLSRVPSTFGGHYDLAAYLVLIIPILASMFFGFQRWFVKLTLLMAVLLGFILMFMTVSRVSFFVLLASLILVLFFQKKRFILFSLPALGLLALIFLSFSTTLLDRFGNTIKEVDVLVDSTTGEPLGHIKEISSTSFKNKLIKRIFVENKNEFYAVMMGQEKNPTVASPSAIIPYSSLPATVMVLASPNTPTGENLPQGTGYINLQLSPVTQTVGQIFYEKPSLPESTTSAKVISIHGNFLIKRASAYDLSFTTRFQGEWPRAIAAFRRNILFGSGFSSISLAVDNNYLRLLGEVGLLGFVSFFSIFIMAGLYIKKALPEVDSYIARSFVFGFIAGVSGLLLNALLIDVFEASKVAFLLWLLTGITIAIVNLYQTKSIDLYKEFKSAVFSHVAIVVYLFAISIMIFSPMISNYFTGDDFTWFRWVADCRGCVFRYFTESDGFFYRPGTKTYFSLMYSIFWLNQSVYHMVSILLHVIVTALLFFLANKVLRNFKLSVMVSFLFLILSGYSEAVFWISSTGFLFNAMFALLSLLFFIYWKEKKKKVYFVISFASIVLSLLFHELGVIAPLLIILYDIVFGEKEISVRLARKAYYLAFLSPVVPYLILRLLAKSHWFSGDYSYNLLKFPFNAVGNAIGYFFLTLFGSLSLPLYQVLRNFSREHILFVLMAALVLIYILILGYRFLMSRIDEEERKVFIFGFMLFIISLLPFLGLGNITSRYSYLASCGTVLLFALFVKKLYVFLRGSGRNISLAVVSLIITLFSLLHIMQVQQIHSDWYEAGEKTRRFFTAIEASYEDYWAKEPMKFYFIDIPIRVGEAWVFPVGLEDALWFSFRNPDISIFHLQSANQVFSLVSGSKNEKIFQFDERGNVIEKKKNLRIK